MTLEANIQAAIIRQAKKRGAWILNTHGSQFGRSGVPDLVLCYRGMFVAMEVKQPGKQPRPLQKHEIKMIRGAGGFAEVVTSVTEAMHILDRVDDLLDD